MPLNSIVSRTICNKINTQPEKRRTQYEISSRRFRRARFRISGRSGGGIAGRHSPKLYKTDRTTKKIIAGGLPVGDRAFVFIVEAKSNDELDQMIRSLPMWGELNWEVTALQTFNARAKQERQAVRDLKRTIREK